MTALMPPVKTGRIGLAADGTVWDLKTSEQISGGGEITMDPAIAVNSGDTIFQGYWVFQPKGNAVCQLIVSDGTATSPASGNIYLLTVI